MQRGFEGVEEGIEERSLDALVGDIGDCTRRNLKERNKERQERGRRRFLARTRRALYIRGCEYLVKFFQVDIREVVRQACGNTVVIWAIHC